MRKLQKIVTERMDALGLTFEDVERRSREGKGKPKGVSHGTVHSVARGVYATMKQDSLEGLARGLDVKLSEILAAYEEDLAHIRRGTITLPARAAELSPEAMQALIAHMDYLLKAERQRRKP